MAKKKKLSKNEKGFRSEASKPFRKSKAFSKRLGNSKNFQSNRKNLVKQLYEAFGEDFLNIIEYDYLTEWVNKLIINLIKEKIKTEEEIENLINRFDNNIDAKESLKSEISNSYES